MTTTSISSTEERQPATFAGGVIINLCLILPVAAPDGFCRQPALNVFLIQTIVFCCDRMCSLLESYGSRGSSFLYSLFWEQTSPRPANKLVGNGWHCQRPPTVTLLVAQHNAGREDGLFVCLNQLIWGQSWAFQVRLEFAQEVQLVTEKIDKRARFREVAKVGTTWAPLPCF